MVNVGSAAARFGRRAEGSPRIDGGRDQLPRGSPRQHFASHVGMSHPADHLHGSWGSSMSDGRGADGGGRRFGGFAGSGVSLRSLALASAGLPDGDDGEEDRARGEYESKEAQLRAAAGGVEKETVQERRARLYGERALFLLKPDSAVRRFFVAIVENKWFDRVSLLVIMVNSIFMAARDPLRADDHPRNAWLNDAEIFFTVAFTVELVVKVLAMGMILHERSYLRDVWNQFDCVIVIFGWLSLFPDASGIGQFSGLRTFRVLRPLKTIRGVKGMRILVNSLLMSVPLLLDVVALLGFAFFIFGILGIQLWSGIMRNRCFVAAQPDVLGEPSNRLCSTWSGGGRRCPATQVCLESTNPNFGITHFDHMGAAFLLIFQTITLEGWSDIMYWLQDAATVWTSIYFIALVVFGSFFGVQLALAVIYGKYAAIFEEQEQKKRAEEELALLNKRRANEVARFALIAKARRRAERKRAAKATKGKAAGGKAAGGNAELGSPKSQHLATTFAAVSLAASSGASLAHHDADNKASGTLLNPLPPLSRSAGTLQAAPSRGRSLSRAGDRSLFSSMKSSTSVVSVASLGGHSSAFASRSPSPSRDLLRSRSPSREPAPDPAGHGRNPQAMPLTSASLAAFHQIHGDAAGRPSRTSSIGGDSIISRGGGGAGPGSTASLAPAATPSRRARGSFTTGSNANGNRGATMLSLPPASSSPEQAHPHRHHRHHHHQQQQQQQQQQHPSLSRHRSATSVFSATSSTGVSTEISSDDLDFDKVSDAAAGPGPSGVTRAMSPTVSSARMPGPPVRRRRGAVVGVSGIGSSGDASGGAATELTAASAAAARAARRRRVAKRGRFGERIQLLCYDIAMHRYFTVFIMAVIIVNTIFLAIEHHNMPKDLERVLGVGNLIFTCIFGVEMFVKIIGLTPSGYVSDRFNVFDSVVMFISLLEYAIGGSGSITVFRAFRLLRIFKLARSWTSLQRMLEIIYRSLPAVGNCSFVLLLFMFIYTILGMQVFGGKFGSEVFYDDDKGEVVVPRHNFDSFLWAFVTVFQVLTGENWNEVLYDGIRATHWTAAFYFVTCVTIGNYMLLNLFQAILLQNFSSSQAAIKGGAPGAGASPSDRDRDRDSPVASPGLHRSRSPPGLSPMTPFPSPRVAPGARRRAVASVPPSRSVSAHTGAAEDGPTAVPPPLIMSGSAALSDTSGVPGSLARPTPQRLRRDQHHKHLLPLDAGASPAVRDRTSTATSEDASSVRSHGYGHGYGQSQSHFQSPSHSHGLAIIREDDHSSVVSSEYASRALSGGGGGNNNNNNNNNGDGPELPTTVKGAFVSLPPLTIASADHSAAVARRHGARSGTGPGRAVSVPPQGESIAAKRTASYVQAMNERAVNGGHDNDDRAGGGRGTGTGDGAGDGTGAGAGNLPALEHRSLFLFSAENRLRLQLRRMVYHPFFETLVIMMIMLSSVALSLETPNMDRTRGLGRALFITDIVFTSLFTMEMLLKIFVAGFVLHRGSYLRNPWNVLDGVIVMISISTLVLSGVDLKFLRALRAMRPLRVVSRSSAMKVVVHSIVRSIPAIFNVIVICGLFWLIFGILAVQLFGGRLWYCTDPSVSDRAGCVGEWLDPEGPRGFAEFVDRRWVNSRPHFDHIMWAMLALFEVATLESWPSTMYLGVDAVGIDVAPRRDHNQLNAFFFLAFIIVGAFFALNLFVGVVIDSFNEMKEEHNGSAFLTKSQREWVEAQKLMQKFLPRKEAKRPDGARRRALFDFVTSPAFEWAIMACIIVNIGMMAANHYQEPDWVGRMLFIANIIFTTIFFLEAALKIAAMTLTEYLKDNWNRFDLFIVLISIPGLFINVGVGATLFRVFRVFRIFKLVRSARGIRTLLQTLLYSLPTLWNVGSLLLLLFFMYAVAGVSLFGSIKRGEFINDYANFENFPVAMITLFRMSTGEAWNGIMHDAMVGAPDCEPELGNCGNSIAPPLFFVSFIVLVSFMLINLFIAVILENFADITKTEESKLTRDQVEEFVSVWSQFDPLATHFLPRERLYALLMTLPAPLGTREVSVRGEALALARTLDIPDYDGSVHFRDVLLALANRSFGVTYVPPCEARARVERDWPKKFRSLRKVIASKPEFTVQDHYAAMHVQAIWRGHVQRKKARGRIAVQRVNKRKAAAKRIRGHIVDLLGGPAAVSRGAAAGRSAAGRRTGDQKVDTGRGISSLPLASSSATPSGSAARQDGGKRRHRRRRRIMRAARSGPRRDPRAAESAAPEEAGDERNPSSDISGARGEIARGGENEKKPARNPGPRASPGLTEGGAAKRHHRRRRRTRRSSTAVRATASPAESSPARGGPRDAANFSSSLASSLESSEASPFTSRRQRDDGKDSIRDPFATPESAPARRAGRDSPRGRPTPSPAGSGARPSRNAPFNQSVYRGESLTFNVPARFPNGTAGDISSRTSVMQRAIAADPSSPLSVALVEMAARRKENRTF